MNGSGENSAAPPTRLYLVTPPQFEPALFPAQLAEALDAGMGPDGPRAACVRLQLGEAAQAELATAAEALRPICHARDVALLTTDAYGRVEALGLDGAHLDAQAAAQSTARARLGPERIMGVHCGRSLDRCFEAGDRRADYVSVGPVGDDLDAEDPGLWTVLEAWREHVVLPLVIEGDLSPASAARLAPWADFIALGAPIWDAPDGPGAAVSRYLKALDAARDADPGG